MSRTTKIVLGILGGVALICCLGVAAFFYIVPAVVERSLSGALAEGPEQAAGVAAEIVDYELPSGYREAGGLSMMGLRMVMIEPEGDSGDGVMIMMMSFPAALAGDEAQMREQMESMVAEQGIDMEGGDLQEFGAEIYVINGQETTFTLFEGTDESGSRVRQMFGPIVTRDGGAGMIMIVGNVESWDQEAVDSFLRSLR